MRVLRKQTAATISLLPLLFTLLVSSYGTAVGQTNQDNASNSPNKSELIAALSALLEKLEAKQYPEAMEFLVAPPGMDPDQLESILRNRELSASGIKQLEQDAEFGTATERFGAERGAYFADRAAVDIDKCFGFNHETKSATAEVIALWDGNQFKLIRVDDVGKLEKAETKGSDVDSNADVAPKATESREEMIRKAAMLLPELAAAVEANPNDISAHAKLAMAQLRIGNTPSAWKQLMTANSIAPKHGGIQRGLDTLIGEFSKLGVFTPGVPPETVQGLLGDPTEKLDLSKRLRWRYAHWGVDFIDSKLVEIVDLRGTTEAVYNPIEKIVTDLGGESFIPALRRKSKGKVSTFYLVPGETLAHHKQMITVERLIGVTENQELKSIVEAVIKQEAAINPGAMHKELSSDDHSVIVAAKFPGGENTNDQHKIFRLFSGEKDLFRLTYTLIAADPPSQETQQKWLKIIQAASLQKIDE